MIINSPIKSNQLINLSILGEGDNPSVLKSIPLFTANRDGSEGFPLVLKNNGFDTRSIKHETNWNFNTISPESKLNCINREFSYALFDYSSNKYDPYYNSYNLDTPTQYDIYVDWLISGVEAADDILAVAYESWTSLEKYTTQVNDKIIAAYISPVHYYLADSVYEETTVYIFSIGWDTYHLNGINYTADLVITYQYGPDEIEVRTTINDNDDGILGPFTASAWPPTIVWEGDSNDPEFWDTPVPTEDTQPVITLSPPPPIGSIPRGVGYILPDNLDPKLSGFLIPSLTSRFQNDLWMDFNNTNDFEIPDYSDIYLDINFGITEGSDPSYLYNFTNEANQRKVYTFGGFIRFNDFIAGLYDRPLIPAKTTIINDDSRWFIVVKDDGAFYSVGLSNHLTWDYEYNSTPTAETNLLIHNTYEVIDYRFISILGIDVVKVGIFPNCGKVDLYTQKNGEITNIVNGSNVVTAISHGLEDQDYIKISGVLTSDAEDIDGNVLDDELDGNSLFGEIDGNYSTPTNANGFKFVRVIDESTIELFNDKELLFPSIIAQALLDQVARWKAVDNSYRYLGTLYSPTGKNGYALEPSLNLRNESIEVSDNIVDMAVETPNPYRSDLTGQISWNNYYPHVRKQTRNTEYIRLNNGNKFGSLVKIKKHNGKYYIAVMERGAEDSQILIDDLDIRNNKVFPYHIPCGRVHMYSMDSSLEYIGSYAAPNHPWESYEELNISDHIAGLSYAENRPIINASIAENNLSTDNYWNGAKQLQWAKEYYFNSDIQFSLPNQSISPLEFGFLDRWKSLDFQIAGSNIELYISPNVGGGNYSTGQYLTPLNAPILKIFFGLSSPELFASTTSYVIDPSYVEINYAKRKSDSLGIGGQVYLSNKHILFSCIATSKVLVVNSFGTIIQSVDVPDLEYIRPDRNTFAAQCDEVGKIYTYAYGKYAYTTDFASEEFDIFNACIVAYSHDEYIGYQLVGGAAQEKFRKPGNTSIIKLAAGKSPSFRDNEVDSDSGETHNSINIITIKSDLSTCVYTSDVHLLEYLPLFVQSYESAEENLNITIPGKDSGSTGMELYLQPILIKTHDIFLFTKQIDVLDTSLDIVLSAPEQSDSNLSIFCHQAIADDTLDLFTEGAGSEGALPLYVNIPETFTFSDNSLDLSIKNFHSSSFGNPAYFYEYVCDLDGNLDFDFELDGNSDLEKSVDGNLGCDSVTSIYPYGLIPIHIESNVTYDHFSHLNLFLQNDGAVSTSSLNLHFADASGAHKSINCTIDGSGYSGTGYVAGMPLFLQRPVESMLPIVVYNTSTGSNLNSYISGAYISESYVNLSISGNHSPNNYLTTYIRGRLS